MTPQTHGNEVPPDSQDEGAHPAQWRVVVLCALIAICDGFDTQAIAFVAPVISKLWGISPGGFGMVFSAGLVGLAIGAVVFGSLADRWGPKRVILICVALFGTASIFTVQATDMAELAIWRAITGLGLGGVLPNIVSLTNEVAAPRLKNTLVMIMFCGFPLGATIGGLTSAPMIEALGWTSVFIAGGVAPLALTPFLWAFLPDMRAQASACSQGSDRASPKGSSLLQQGRALSTLLLWLAFFCNLLVMYFLVNWLPSLLSLGGSKLSVATMSTALLNLGGIAGALVFARLINRTDNLLLLALSYLAATGAVVVIGLAQHSLPLILGGALIAGAVVVGGQIAMNAVAASYYPADIRSTGVGWALGVGRVGSIIGPMVGGLLLSAGWDGTSTVIFASLPTIFVALALLGLRYANRPKAPPAVARIRT